MALTLPRALRGYELIEEIGVGGFGAVYRAMQPILGREVAIKVILPQHANQPDFVRRFEAEAQLIARLEHPHIVPLFDYWREPDGAFLVMRWIRGGSLKALLKDGARDSDWVLRLLDQISGALMVAHRAGVVHLDIKPDNILIDEDDNGYLTDFGIAQILGRDMPGETEMFSGTIPYAAPEQLRSQPLSPQSDQYALALVAFEMLTGQYIYEGQAPSQIIYNHINEPIPDVSLLRPELPLAVNEVLQRATAKDPQDRYGDVRAFVAALQAAFTPQTSDWFEFEPEGDFFILNPYKGLRSFEQADADDFFGRETLTAQLLARLREDVPARRFLAVVGPSGSGKSSAVKAGLLPALRNGALDDEGSADWFIAEMLPGDEPLSRLEAALTSVALRPPADLRALLTGDGRGLVRAASRVLAGMDSQLLLVIDQFEEVFTLVRDEAERAHFLQLITEAVLSPDSRVRVIVTLRADFYDRPLLYENIGALVQARTHTVLPLSADEIARAVTGPAERVGLQVDAGLVAAIVGDVREEPGTLPLLQHALTELFERREGRRLTLAAYAETGGVLGALARSADAVYAALAPAQAALARQIFLRLVTLGEGTEDTRRRVRLAELLRLGDAEPVNAVLNAFGAHRLLTFDSEPGTREPQVEVAHEALIRTWGLLRGWLDESRADVRQQRQLAAAAADWSSAGRRVDYLLTGGRLAQAEEWAKTTPLTLTDEERAFLAASAAERARREAEERARETREIVLVQRSRTRSRLLAAAVVVALLGGVLTLFALTQRGEAVAARATSEANADIAVRNAATATVAQGQAVVQANEAAAARAEAASLAQAAAAQQVFTRQNINDLALALALEANHLPNPPVLAQSVLAEVAFAPGLRRVLRGHEEAVFNVLYTPDGATAISSAYDATLRVWDVATGETRHILNGHEEGGAVVDVSADGTLALSGSIDEQLILWDVATGEARATFDAPRGAVNDVDLNADGTQALLAFDDGSVVLWDATTGETLATLEGSAYNPPYTVALNREGTRALAGYLDGRVVLWNLERPAARRVLGSHGPEAMDVLFAPDGQTAFSAADFEVFQWDIESETLVRRLDLDDEIFAIDLSPDGQNLLVASTDLTVYDATSGERLRRFGGLGLVIDAVFSPDGRSILSGQGDATLRQWDLVPGSETERLLPQRAPSRISALSPDGKMALTGDWRGGLRLWQVSATEDTPAGTLVRQFGNSERRRGTDAQINALAYSPDGTLVLAGTRGGGLNLWDVATGEVLWAVQANPLSVWSVAFTPDGRFALSPTDGDHVALWSVETGERWRILESAGGTVYDLAISPDGRYVAAAHEDGTLSLWELRNGALTTLDGHDIAVQSVAFSPDGTRLASGADDGTLMLWDVATGVPTREWGEGEGVFEIVWNADGTLLLTGARGGEVVLWDAATGERRSTYNHHQQDVYSVHFAPDGVTGFSAADDLRFVQWALADGTVTRVFGGDAGHADTAPLFGLAAYTSDGAGRVIAAADDGTLTVWNTEAGAPLLTLRGHQFAVNAVDVHPDTALAVSVGVDGTVRVWNLATGELLHTLYGHVGSVTSVAFSPDGRTAASSGTDGVILLWDVEHGRQIRTLFGFEAASVYDIAFSPDGQRLAAGSSDPDAFVTLWDVERGELLHRMSGHTNTVFSVAFSPDGSTLASGGGDNLIILWDAATGAPVRTFASGHALAINSVAYSPDGTLLVSGGLDNLVMLWDVATGQVLRVLEGHTDSVNIATFMPDGETAVSAGGDFTIRLWQIPSLDTLLAWTLENRAVRPLTCDERRLYGVTPPCDAAGNLPTAEVTPPPPATSTPEPTRAPSVTPVLTPTPTLTPLAPRAAQPGEQRGELVAGTSDVWTFDGEVGMRVTISVIADQPSRDPEEGLDTFLRVFAPDGTLLDENDDILSAENPNSELTVMLRANGAYTLVVASYGFAGGGGYTLTVRED